MKEAASAELRDALKRCKTGFFGVGLFSAMLNLLALTGSLYMLQVYDRVIPSHSVPTLVGLTLVMLLLFTAYGLLDFVRLRLMVRIANRLDRLLHKRIFAISLALPLRAGPEGASVQPIRDLDTIKGFLSSTGPTAFFDLPWIPFYIALIYLLHPDLGLLATGGAILIVTLTVLAERLGRASAKRAIESGNRRRGIAEAGRRNAEVIHALGLGDRLTRRWETMSADHLRNQQKLSDVVGSMGSLSRSLRMMLQSLMLGLGAYLVINGEASSGVIIASSIMLGRALAPVDIAIANWKGIVAARQSWTKLNRLLNRFTATHQTMVLPRPEECLTVESLAVGPPGEAQPLIANVGFRVEAGTRLGIIGPSGSGKSTLVRALVGAWLPMRGTVRLDGASLDQWDAAALGRHVGYLPQDIELFDGTIAENIARFDEDPDPAAILAASQAAGVHKMILRLPQGFQTRVGDAGKALSAGQRQLVGLARALYGNPFLVVLDEPNSNLDADGDAALSFAIDSVRERGGIVIVVAHRPAALANVDQLLIMAGGALQAFGSRDEVLARLRRPAPTEPRPFGLVRSGDKRP
ncbi:type I secretion system permease/ATPase [Mesorhizobium sp. RP14(2022)]|uniref:Type I secretion system permease/ATPase n=1 Tax=Mesorhizobium liriopis TaxID=2953882 RepID=A0ABT1C2T3_9HYPH|nr:type I secretion system permease/ATPase [Mesorhizobium liriopis]MCO6049124.1 type I secretion system permease/ATPase [Mesorhizobium liriopis]